MGHEDLLIDGESLCIMHERDMFARAWERGVGGRTEGGERVPALADWTVDPDLQKRRGAGKEFDLLACLVLSYMLARRRASRRSPLLPRTTKETVHGVLLLHCSISSVFLFPS